MVSVHTVIFVVAGMSLLLGLVAVAFEVQLLQILGANAGSILAGLVYGGLAFHRFVAFKCEIAPQGLRMTSSRGGMREVVFAELRALLGRQLPSDPPWSSQVLLDAVPQGDNGSGEPVRIFGTTVVNYGALPKGASTSRLENLRNFAAHLAAQNPALSIDPETAQFIEGPKVPARFPTMVEFHAYDSRFGE